LRLENKQIAFELDVGRVRKNATISIGDPGKIKSFKKKPGRLQHSRKKGGRRDKKPARKQEKLGGRETAQGR